MVGPSVWARRFLALLLPLLAGSAFGRAGLACGLPCCCLLVEVTWGFWGGADTVAVSGSSVVGEPSFPALALFFLFTRGSRKSEAY